MKRNVTNWGLYPRLDAEVRSFEGATELKPLLQNGQSYIARGNGRCYGDASLNDQIISTLRHNKFLELNPKEAYLDCQSGITLDEVLKVTVPRGFFVPVTPGTKYITVGGAVASDVHGKNHHKEGCFADHVIDMDILTGSGEVITCGPGQNEALFEATRGGMGLTGIILRIKFKLKRIETSFIREKQIKARNLDEIFALFEEYKDSTYSVSWIDCFQKGKNLGRSILMVGEHATRNELSPAQMVEPLKVHDRRLFSMPAYLPEFALNPFSIRGFNFLYYQKNLKPELNGIVPYNPFFYPLDAVLEWNKMYGKQGFVQYQFVLPLESSRQGLEKILLKINEKKMGSFLAVLKLFGKQENLISFPMEGYTLALDFPVRDGLFSFLDELDAIVADFGGRVYLSKDARMLPGMFRKGYPRWQEFINVLEKYNSGFRFNSLQAKRLGITI